MNGRARRDSRQQEREKGAGEGEGPRWPVTHSYTNALLATHTDSADYKHRLRYTDILKHTAGYTLEYTKTHIHSTGYTHVHTTCWLHTHTQFSISPYAGLRLCQQLNSGGREALP